MNMQLASTPSPSPTPNLNLPDEIWAQIFDLAADEDVLFQCGFPTAMAESAWYKDPFLDKLVLLEREREREQEKAQKGFGDRDGDGSGGDRDKDRDGQRDRRASLESVSWRLRSPQEAMNLLQRRSYATKKAIVATCRQWRAVGSEFLFRCLHVSDPAKLTELCARLDASAASATTVTASLGWWTRRIHLARYHPSPASSSASASSHGHGHGNAHAQAQRRAEPQMSDAALEKALVALIKHCPNLEIFVIERPLGAAFGPVADALATRAARRLHTVQFTLPGASLAKLLWALAALPRIAAAHVHIATPVPAEQEHAHLGSAGGMRVRMGRLQQLVLRGCVEELVEQAAGWEMPVLRAVEVGPGGSGGNADADAEGEGAGAGVGDAPDVLEFVRAHGMGLLFLDLDCGPLPDIPSILAQCPNLTTFAFNADWRLAHQQQHPGAGAGSSGVSSASVLVSHPHPSLTTIGLHGLHAAFGVGPSFPSPSSSPSSLLRTRARLTQQANDATLAALTKRNFPHLTRVRALSRTLLGALNRADGPCVENGGYARWSRWWGMCVGAGVRLEDCTGQVLGTLPVEEEGGEEEEEEEDEDEEEEEEEKEKEEDREEEEDSDGWGSEPEEEQPQPQAVTGRTSELTRLLAEVRAMNEGRDEALIARIRITRPDSPGF